MLKNLRAIPFTEDPNLSRYGIKIVLLGEKSEEFKPLSSWSSRASLKRLCIKGTLQIAYFKKL